MELTLSTKRYWKRRLYNRLDSKSSTSSRTSSKLVRFGRLRRLKPILNLKLVSPLKLWRRFKNAYMTMMLQMAGGVGDLNYGSGFGGKHISRAREVKLGYTREEFEKRIAYEIYKSLVASSHLGSAYA